jgi:hypothetical protein
MKLTTKQLLLGALGTFVLALLLGGTSSLVYGENESGVGPNLMWIGGNICLVATVLLLIGAGVSFFTRRSAKAL